MRIHIPPEVAPLLFSCSSTKVIVLCADVEVMQYAVHACALSTAPICLASGSFCRVSSVESIFFNLPNLHFIPCTPVTSKVRCGSALLRALGTGVRPGRRVVEQMLVDVL